MAVHVFAYVLERGESVLFPDGESKPPVDCSAAPEIKVSFEKIGFIRIL